MATTGKAAWDKYFSSGDVETTTKTEYQLIPAGSKVTVKDQTEYTPTVVVDFKNKSYQFPFSFLKKPNASSKEEFFKPDKMGIVGNLPYPRYIELVRKSIDNYTIVGENIRAVLTAMVDFVSGNIPKSKLKVTLGAANLSDSMQRNISKNFLEVLGPIYICVNEVNGNNTKSNVFLPHLGNYALMDFSIITNGFEDKYSAKVASISSNTLKVSNIVSRVETNTSIKKKWGKTHIFTICKILSDSSVKVGSITAAQYLANNFSNIGVSKQQISKDMAAGNALDWVYTYDTVVAKFIKTNQLDDVGSLTDLVIDTMQDSVRVIKGSINFETGDIKIEINAMGKSKKDAQFRSKNAKGRAADKLGIQL